MDFSGYLSYQWKSHGKDPLFGILCDKYDQNIEVMLPGVNCMYWPGRPEQTKGKEKDFHLPENNDKELYKVEG